MPTQTVGSSRLEYVAREMRAGAIRGGACTRELQRGLRLQLKLLRDPLGEADPLWVLTLSRPSVAPGDRIDTILTAVLVCPTQYGATGRVAGLALTGGFVPEETVLKELEAAGVPTVLCQEDTYTVATKLRDLVFKLRPQDTEKIAAAQQLVIEHTEVPAIMKGLGR